MYILKQLHHQGMTESQIQTVAQALIVSRLLYSLPAWGFCCFCCAKLIEIDAFLRRIKRYGYVTRDYCVAAFMRSSDYELFGKALKPGHCLHDLLPVARNILPLRRRGHDLCCPIVLITCTSSHLLRRVCITCLILNFDVKAS